MPRYRNPNPMLIRRSRSDGHSKNCGIALKETEIEAMYLLASNMNIAKSALVGFLIREAKQRFDEGKPVLTTNPR